MPIAEDKPTLLDALKDSTIKEEQNLGSQSIWFVAWGEDQIKVDYDPNRPRPKRTLADRWNSWLYRREQQWSDFRWWLGDKIENLSWRIKP